MATALLQNGEQQVVVSSIYLHLTRECGLGATENEHGKNVFERYFDRKERI